MKEPLAQSTVAVRYGFNHKIKTECAYQNKAIPVFLGSTAALCVLSLLYLDVDWIKLAAAAGYGQYILPPGTVRF